MNQNFLCPFPNRWSEIYNDLCEAYEASAGIKLPSIVSERRSVGGPPTPLILNGWVFSNDDDKQERWQETLRWAERHNLLHLATVEERDKCFSAGHTRSGGICFKGEYCEYTNEIISKYKLSEYITLNQYISDPVGVKAKLPESQGIYFVIYPHEWPEDLFLPRGTGGYFKGKDPNVSIEELWSNWVEEADILYIGKAGGIRNNGNIIKSTLRKRIIALLQFGNGKNVGHWGGRYLWQHENSPDFRVYWYTCTDENSICLEEKLIKDFQKMYNKKPYANLR